MQQIYKNIIIGSLILLGSSLILPKSVQAQKSLELTVSPPISYIKVAPGTKQNHAISLKNTGSSPITVTPQIVDFYVNGETGQPILLDSHSFPYFTMPDASLKPVTVEPSQVAQLQLAIEAPATAPDKEYPLSVIFSSVPEEDSQQVTKVTGSLASNLVVLISDKNKLEKKLSVSDFDAPRVIDSFRGITVKPILTNERFSTAAASGSAALVSWTGETLTEYQIYPDNILGFSSRPIRGLDISGDTPQTIDFTFNSTFMIGPYSLIIQLDNDGHIETYSETIIAFPFSVIIAAAVGLTVGFIYWLRTQNNTKIRL